MTTTIPSGEAAVRSPARFKRSDIGPMCADFYRENGFLIIADALSAREIDGLRRDTVRLCRGDYGSMEGYEVPPADTPDDELLGRVLCIHMAHKVSPVMRRALSHPVLVDVLTRIISPNVKCMQSMLFIKAAGKPGQAWHQDEDFIPTRDRSLCGAWMALDDATIDNGCLWVIPGSHRAGILWPMYPHDDPRFDCTQMSYDFPYTDADAIPVEVSAGAMVFFNGYLLHMSLNNKRAGGYRRALVNHYMSAESTLPWFANAQLGGAQNDMRDIVMVAGTDHYAWKGTVDILRSHIRPSGQGGCGDGRMPLEEYRRQRQTGME